MRSTTPDHHHHDGVAPLDPKEELILLAQSKGQVLKAFALQRIQDELGRRGIPWGRFIEEIRPHFKNNIVNPAGFMIDFARRFRIMSSPAIVIKSPARSVAACGVCQDNRLIRGREGLEPCPECSTEQFRQDWELREKQRAERARSLRVLHTTDAALLK